MNILLVDDDVYVVETLKKTMPWKTMGIEGVYTAYGVSRAKKIIEEVPIHILVCDIEMPKENGFVLLNWIREHHYIMEIIMLTMYGEFDYASQAIEYHCNAYILKPVDCEKLEALVRKAMEDEARALKGDELLHSPVSQKMYREQFLLKLLENETVTQQEFIKSGYREDVCLIPIMISCYSPYVEGAILLSEVWIRNAIKHIEKTDSIDNLEYVCQFHEHKQYMMIFSTLEKQHFLTLMELFLSEMKRTFGPYISIVLGMESDYKGLKCNVLALQRYVDESLLFFGKVMTVDSYKLPIREYKKPDFEQWKAYLIRGECRVLKENLFLFIKNNEKKGDKSRKHLKRLMNEYNHMVNSALFEKGICIYLMDEKLVDYDIFLEAGCSSQTAIEALEMLTDAAVSVLLINGEGDSVSGRLTAYIDEHIGESLSREVLSKQANMNPDYLARIFKQETGESPGNYIIRRRMELARQKLIQTQEPVNQIAVAVGYDNFSYFTKLFKSHYGMTPKEMRRRIGTCQ